MSRPRAAVQPGPVLTIRLSLAALVAATGWGVSSCLSWTERLCTADETVVQQTEHGGGASCRPREEGDPECPEGERARVVESSGRADCVEDVA